MIPILTKIGKFANRLTRKVSEKFKAYLTIKHYVTAETKSSVFYPILTYFHQYIDSNIYQIVRTVVGASLDGLNQILKRSHFKELTILQNNTRKINDLHQIT